MPDQSQENQITEFAKLVLELYRLNPDGFEKAIEPKLRSANEENRQEKRGAGESEGK